METTRDAGARLRAQVVSAIEVRLLQDRHFPGLAANARWNMLLDLLLARCDGRRISINSLCIAARAPATTALRHIDRLEEAGWLAKTPDSHDGRREWVALTEAGLSRLESYFADRMALREADVAIGDRLRAIADEIDRG